MSKICKMKERIGVADEEAARRAQADAEAERRLASLNAQATERIRLEELDQAAVREK